MKNQSTLADPYMSVRDSTGNTKLAESDDGGTGYNSRFTYTATTTGNFFLAAGAGFHITSTSRHTMTLGDWTSDVGSADHTGTTGAISVGGTATGNIETVNDTD